MVRRKLIRATPVLGGTKPDCDEIKGYKVMPNSKKDCLTVTPPNGDPVEVCKIK